MTNDQETKLFQYRCVRSCKSVGIIFLLPAGVSYGLMLRKLPNLELLANEAIQMMLSPPRTQKSNDVLYIWREMLARASEIENPWNWTNEEN
jgi:hypothetical protein